MLVWAREEVGYSIEQAAEAIGLPVEKLEAAESEEHQLTLNQLRTAAEKYGCPFGYFYFDTASAPILAPSSLIRKKERLLSVPTESTKIRAIGWYFR